MTTQQHAGRWISKLSNKLRRKIDGFSSKGEFSGSQGKALHFILTQTQDIFQKDIEEEYSLRPSTATELLKKMEQNGLIYREPMANDARMKKIVVTNKALQYKDLVTKNILGLEEELTRDIPKEDLAVFFRVMEKMLENIS
ncbi:MarR family transcriptional regulator [Clostridiaceae bacterium]|nr:MarR family transcriptional regulator [Clostridiaceae bacterium]